MVVVMSVCAKTVVAASRSVSVNACLIIGT
jgi:hypothetical protein